jgi:hypothetical protein
MGIRFLVEVLSRESQVVLDRRGFIDSRLPKGGSLLAPDDGALRIDDLLRRPQVIVLVEEGFWFGFSLGRRLDPNRIGTPQSIGLPTVFGDELGFLGALL